MHISYEGGILEDPWAEPPENIFQLTRSPENAEAEAEYHRDFFCPGRAGGYQRRAHWIPCRCCWNG